MTTHNNLTLYMLCSKYVHTENTVYFIIYQWYSPMRGTQIPYLVWKFCSFLSLWDCGL